MLLVMNTMLLVPLAAWLAGWTRPRSASAWVAALLVFMFAAIVLVSEAVGRFSYAGGTITLACVALGAVGLGLWWRRPVGPPRLDRTDLARRARVLTGGWPQRVVLAVWLALLAYSVLAVVVLPPTVPDVLRYHLPMGVRWMQEGRIGAFDFLDYRASYFPHNVELLNAWCLLLTGSDRLICLPQVIISGAAWPVVGYLAMRGCGVRRRWALFGGLLASMNAPVALQMRNEMIDAGFYAVFIVALLAAVGRGRFYGRSWIVFAAATGLALGSKSSGVLAAGVVGLAWAVGWWLEARRAIPWRRAAVELAAAGAIVLALGAWVFGANLVQHGNPFFPIAMQIGPVTLPTADETHPIHSNPWMTDFGHSHGERLVGGLARWPRLLLSLPPYHRFRSAGSGGFGFLTTACVVMSIGLLALSAAVPAWRARLRRGFRGGGQSQSQSRGSGRGIVWPLLGLLAAWNVLFLSFVSLITAPYSLVDSRYQVHLALVFALLAVKALTAVPRAVRLASAWALVAVFCLTAWIVLTDCPQRGWRMFRAVVLLDRDRLYPYTGRPIFVANDPRAFFEQLGDEPLMVLARGRIFPFYYLSFDRMIYPVTMLGADERQVNRPDVPDEVLARSLGNLAASKQLLTPQNTATAERWREVTAAFMAQPEVLRDGVAFWEALAERYGVRLLYSDAGVLGVLDASPRWERVMAQDGRNPRHSMALYRYVGGAD